MIVDKFDAEEMWRLVEKHRVNVIGVTGDAMARPLADALEKLQDERRHVVARLVREHRRDLLADGEGAARTSCCPTPRDDRRDRLDRVGHERHPLRAEGRRAEGRHHDGAWRRPTPSCSTTTSNPLEPGSGVGRPRSRAAATSRSATTTIPEKTAATFITDAQGRRWSIPGDYALLEADGRITLLGRGSVSINSGGEKIYPEEVEGALKSHPDVFDVLVVGVPDERWGERVAALLQPRPGQTPTLEELQAHCRTRIAGYKVPRELLLVDEVPRLPNGKPDYRQAKEQARALAAAD